MDDTFLKIIEGKAPAYIIFETEKSLAFLDKNPVSPGHTLVIPKKFAENIFDLDEENAKDLIITVKKVSEILKEKLSCDGVNILNASGKAAHQSVFHIHFHVIPRFFGDGLSLNFHGKHASRNLEEIFRKLTS